MVVSVRSENICFENKIVFVLIKTYVSPLITILTMYIHSSNCMRKMLSFVLAQITWNTDLFTNTTAI